MKRALWLVVFALVTAALTSAPVVINYPGDLTSFAASNERVFASDDLDGLRESAPKEESPAEFAAFAARMRSASQLWVGGSKEPAYLEMEAAIRDYSALQRTQFPMRRLSQIEQDVFDIREVVRAHGNYRRPFRAAILNPDVYVTLFNMKSGIVTVNRPLANRPWTLFMRRERTKTLEGILEELDVRPYRPGSHRLDRLWQQFMGVFPGHMQTWSMRATPALAAIEFHDHGRRHATVHILDGDAEGSEVEFEKVGGTWRWVRVISSWIV